MVSKQHNLFLFGFLSFPSFYSSLFFLFSSLPSSILPTLSLSFILAHTPPSPLLPPVYPNPFFPSSLSILSFHTSFPSFLIFFLYFHSPLLSYFLASFQPFPSISPPTVPSVSRPLFFLPFYEGTTYLPPYLPLIQLFTTFTNQRLFPLFFVSSFHLYLSTVSPSLFHYPEH